MRNSKKYSRDDFTPATKILLAKRVAYRCSNPDCKRVTIGPNERKDKSNNIGKASHITGAAPGGPRYDPTLTRQERRSPNNGIWLCASCADFVDNDEDKYPIELLYEWRQKAESEAEEELKRPTLACNVDIQTSTLLNTALITQQKQLSDLVLSTEEKELEKHRKAFRQGKIEEPEEWVKTIKENTSVWNVLSPMLKSRIITFQANIELEKGTAIPQVRKLIEEAKRIWKDVDVTSVLAISDYYEKGSDAAFSFLEGKILDQRISNLKASMYLEIGEFSKSFDILDKIVKKPIPGATNDQIAESLRLLSMINLCNKNITDANLFVNRSLELEKENELIQFTAGVIFYYSAYLPIAVPGKIEPWPEPPILSFIKTDAHSVQILEKALTIFEKLIQNANDFKIKKYCLDAWKLACLANIPDRRESASIYCQDILHKFPANSPIIIWGIARSIDFDIEKSTKELEKDISEKISDIQKIIALLVCYTAKEKYKEAETLLIQTKSLFEKVNGQSIWFYWYAHTLIKLDKADQAIEEIDRSGISTKLADIKSTALRHIAIKNNNWQALFEHLERTYLLTNDAIYLYDICWHKAGQKDWKYIADRAKDLVNSLGNCESIRLSAISLYNCKRYKECISLLEENIYRLPNEKLSAELTRIKAQAKAELGKIIEAVREAEKAVALEPTAENKMVLAQLYVRSGNLPKLNILAKEIIKDNSISTYDLLQISEVIMLFDYSLAVEIFEKAINLGIENKDVPNAFGISCQLGIEHKHNNLFERMTSLANKPGSNVFTYSFEETIKLIQDTSQHNVKLQEIYLKGQAPIHVIARDNYFSLALLYHKILNDNALKNSQMQKYPLFSCYGGRNSCAAPSKENNLIMDITSILLAEHLRILDIIIEKFNCVLISAESNQAFIKMQELLLHTQPSLLPAKKLIISLLNKDKIKRYRLDTVKLDYSKEYFDELGEHWLYMYDIALTNKGYFVDVLPVNKIGTIETAKKLPNDSTVVLTNCRSIFDCLKENGLLSIDDYENAIIQLGSIGIAYKQAAKPTFGSKLYCNIGILESLANSGFFELICDKFEICVIESECQRLKTELNEYEDLLNTKTWLNNLINKINRWLEKNRITQIPAYNEDNSSKKGLEQNIYIRCFLSVMTYNAEKSDIICIDDRWANSFLRKDHTSIINILDVLKMLVDEKCLSIQEYYHKLNSLRAENVCYLPITKDEIIWYLKRSSVKDGILVETEDLAIIRKYTASSFYYNDNFQKPPMANESANKLGEIPYIISITRNITDTFIGIWNDETIVETDCKAYSNWLLENLYQDEIPFLVNPAIQNESYLVAINVSGLLVQGIEFNPRLRERRKKYFDWLYSVVISPRLISTPNLYNTFIKYIKELLISTSLRKVEEQHEDITLSILQKLYEDMPGEICDTLSSDEEFMKALGFEKLNLVYIGDLIFHVNQFYPSLKRLVNGEEITITASKPNCIITFKPYRHNNKYGFQFKHPITGEIKTVADDVFGILLESKSDRDKYIQQHRFWFDCDQPCFNSCMDDLSHLNPQEAIDYVGKWKKGSYTIFYRELNAKIQRNEGVQLDKMIPLSIDGLIRHLRINDLNENLKVAFLIEDIATKMMEEEGLYVACERLAGLPIIFPQFLIDKICTLNDQEQRSLIKKMLKTANSPISTMHFAFILSHLVPKGKNVVRVLKKTLNYILSESYRIEFELFHKILRWVDEEFSTKLQFVNLNPFSRSAIVWEHGHRLYSILKANGINNADLQQCLSQRPQKIIYETFKRDSAYWHDISNPRRLNYKAFLLMGISYGIAQTSKEIGFDFIIDICQKLTFPSEKVPTMPDFGLIFDPKLACNSLNSFLGKEREEQLCMLLKEKNIPNLNSAVLYSSVKESIEKLISDSNESNLWLSLFFVTGCCPIYESLRNDVKKVFSKIDLNGLLKNNDPDTMFYILQFIAAQLLIVADKSLCEYLEKQLAELLKSLNSNGEKHEGVSLACAELALNLSIAHGTIGEGNSEAKFAQIIDNFLDIWIKLLPGLSLTIRRLYYESSVSNSNAFWPLLMKLRAL